jgi:capsid protein
MSLISSIRRAFTRPRRQADDLAELMGRYATLRATYDAARTTDEFKNYWANADTYDADSANSREVRHTLVSRARYEIGNNGYADGIAQTYATDLVGLGPNLRMQTGSAAFNRMVELDWFLWTKAVQFRRKFWTMAHAKFSDGEAIGVMRRNPRTRHPLKLDVVLIETEQCQTPFLPYGVAGYIDGIRFDEFGNPVYYDILHGHPGSINTLTTTLVPEQVAADRVLHWFKMRRPGQHRGIPESASTLNTGAAARRWREATLAAAETAADFSVFLKTGFQPDQIARVAPMSSLDIKKRMMTSLPDGWDVMQMKAEHPSATYEGFHDQLINEQARPANMPKNKAKCDSSQYNYASGRLDHQTYYAALDVERRDADDLVLDPLFSLWFDLAIATYGWLGGDPLAVSAAAKLHLWDWPKHRVADVESEANAIKTRLQSGQAGLHQVYSDSGLDLEDEIPAMASTYGITEDEMRERLLDVILPPKKAPTPAPTPVVPVLPDEVPEEAEAIAIIRQILLARGANGNGKTN